MSAIPSARKALLAKVHLGAAQLGLDDEDRRAILERVTGHRSSSEASDADLEAVIAEYRRSGWVPRPKRGPVADAPTQLGKIRALWADLHRLGAVRDPDERALRSWCRRQGLGDAPEFIDTATANRAIEALKRWVARISADTNHRSQA